MDDLGSQQRTDWGLHLTPSIGVALAQLAEAGKCADDADRDPWEFAVEIGALAESGVTVAALRWLVCRGYVEHARELTKSDDPVRRFRVSSNLSFVEESCFILTPAGMALAGNGNSVFLLRFAPEAAPRPASRYAGRRIVPALTPHWDEPRQILSVGGRLVKQFRVPSPNQEAVLAAFQGEGWPPHIGDPLPPLASPQDAKIRLHDTIKCLNARQKSRLIRFHGDGRGCGVLWELVAEPAAQEAHDDQQVRRAA
jgi:hypothetical protein